MVAHVVTSNAGIYKSTLPRHFAVPRVPHAASKNANFRSKAWRRTVDDQNTRTANLCSGRALLQVLCAIYCAESGAWGVLAASRCETADIDFRP